MLRLRGYGSTATTWRSSSFLDDDRGRSLYVSDPDGNVVKCWTWDVQGHLAGYADLRTPSSRSASENAPSSPRVWQEPVDCCSIRCLQRQSDSGRLGVIELREGAVQDQSLEQFPWGRASAGAGRPSCERPTDQEPRFCRRGREVPHRASEQVLSIVKIQCSRRRLHGCSVRAQRTDGHRRSATRGRAGRRCRGLAVGVERRAAGDHRVANPSMYDQCSSSSSGSSRSAAASAASWAETKSWQPRSVHRGDEVVAARRTARTSRRIHVVGGGGAERAASGSGGNVEHPRRRCGSRRRERLQARRWSPRRAGHWADSGSSPTARSAISSPSMIADAVPTQDEEALRRAGGGGYRHRRVLQRSVAVHGETPAPAPCRRSQMSSSSSTATRGCCVRSPATR